MSQMGVLIGIKITKNKIYQILNYLLRATP